MSMTATRRSFLGSVGATAALTLAAPMAFTAKLKPRNIVFILSDDHRYDCMSFLGKPSFLETPNMDRMAREGAHLQNAFVSTSLCSPSRATIFTGQYAHTHGVVDNNVDIPTGTVFFPQCLQKAGYRTGFFGKWHMGHDSDDPRPGFDKWVSFRGQGVYFDPELNVDGAAVKRQGYITDLLTDYAIDWLKQERDVDKPFFLFLSHKAVHAMFEPAERHRGRYENVKIDYPPSMADTEENYRGKPAWVRAQRNSWHGVDYLYHGQLEFDAFYKRYCETLLALDDGIGRVLNFLDQNGLGDDTLVMYMGDNGFCFGEHGLIDKRHMYEPSMRVPLLVRCPALINPGLVVPQLVQNIDIAPTILDAAGVSAPTPMAGRSFLPLLEGRRVEWRDRIYYEYYWENNFPHTPTTLGVRTDQWKYIHYHGVWDTDEFYDMKNDPQEMNNLIAAPECRTVVDELREDLWNWLERSGGMNIPLRRDQGFRADQRKPK